MKHQRLSRPQNLDLQGPAAWLITPMTCFFDNQLVGCLRVIACLQALCCSKRCRPACMAAVLRQVWRQQQPRCRCHFLRTGNRITIVDEIYCRQNCIIGGLDVGQPLRCSQSAIQQCADQVCQVVMPQYPGSAVLMTSNMPCCHPSHPHLQGRCDAAHCRVALSDQGSPILVRLLAQRQQVLQAAWTTQPP